MSHKTSKKALDALPTELVFYKTQFNKTLEERIKIGEELFNRQVYSQEDLKKNKDDYYTWTNNNSEYLKKAFNKENNEHKKNYDDADAFFFGSTCLRNTPLDSLKGLKDKIIYKVCILKKIRASTETLKNQLPIKTIRIAI